MLRTKSQMKGLAARGYRKFLPFELYLITGEENRDWLSYIKLCTASLAVFTSKSLRDLSER